MSNGSELLSEYWEYLEDEGLQVTAEGRAAIDRFNAFLEPRLRSILAANKMDTRQDILLAVDPRPGFTAYSFPLPSGYVIAHSVNLPAAVNGVCAALAAVVPAESGGTELPQFATADQAAETIGLVLNKARDDGDVPAVVLPEGRRHEFATALAERTMNYAICHELAHVTLGHFERQEHQRKEAINVTAWAREMEADQEGLILFLTASGLSADQVSAYIGPTVFFNVAEWFYGIRLPELSEEGPSIEVISRFNEHPPAANRRNALIAKNHPDHQAADTWDLEYVTRLMVQGGRQPMEDVSAQVVEALQAAAEACDPHQLDQLLNTTGADEAGLTAVAIPPVLHQVREDREWAEGALARTALFALRHGRVTGATARSHLGFLYNIYVATYLSATETSAEVQEFDALLRDAVPDLDLIAAEQAHLSWGQLYEDDGDDEGYQSPAG